MQTMRVMLAVCAALFLAGCAHVRPIGSAASVSEFHDVNRSLAGREAVVRLTDGTRMLAHDVRVSQESVSLRLKLSPSALTDWPESTQRDIPLAEVASITVTCRGRGALDGLLIGLLGGTVGGALFGAAAFPGGTYMPSSRTDCAMLGGIVFGVLGVGLGTLYGAGTGSTHVYEFEASQAGGPSAGPRGGLTGDQSRPPPN